MKCGLLYLKHLMYQFVSNENRIARVTSNDFAIVSEVFIRQFTQFLEEGAILKIVRHDGYLDPICIYGGEAGIGLESESQMIYPRLTKGKTRRRSEEHEYVSRCRIAGRQN